MKKLLLLLVLPVILSLAACGPSNQLVGESWVGKGVFGGTNTLVFTGDTLTTIEEMKGAGSSESTTEIDSYKVEEGRVGVVIAAEGGKSKSTTWFKIISPERISTPGPFGDMEFVKK